MRMSKPAAGIPVVQVQEGVKDIVDVGGAGPRKRGWPRKVPVQDMGGKAGQEFLDPDKGTVPYRVSGDYLNPGIQEASPGKVCEEGDDSSLDQASLMPSKRATVETQQQGGKHVLKVLPTHSRHDTAKSGANRVRTLHYV